MAKLAVLCLFAAVPSHAIRKRRGADSVADSLPTWSGAPRQAVGEKGRISELYTFGTPACASPPLVNPNSADGCWPGLRVVSAREEGFVVAQQTDPVVLITEPFGFEQLPLNGAKFFLDIYDNESREIKWANCGEPWPERPTEIVDPLLHIMRKVYVGEAKKYPLGEKVLEVINVPLNISRDREADQESTSEVVKSWGWNLIGTAQVDGWDWIHDSVSHLIQEPNTMSCVLTFRGSRSASDWVNNIQVKKGHFCGLVDEDETCSFWSSCETRKPHGSFVHKGFRDHFRSVVSSDGWKQNIKPHLSGCSEVIAIGHSLGGVAAAYLGRCAAQDLQPGDYGYEDYELVSWTVGEPRVLPSVKA